MANPASGSLVTATGELRRGVHLVLPVLPGMAAWGLVSGVAAVNAGLDGMQACAMTLLMYAGSAQLACLPLMAAGAPLAVVMLTAGIVNLRFLIYGFALSPTFRDASPGRKLLLGYLNTDPAYVLFTPRRDEEPTRPHARSLYLDMTVGAWFVWQTASAVGILLAGRIPPQWGLELAGMLALLALAIPLITSMPMVAGCAVAALVALIGADWPLRLGIIVAASAGVGAAVLVESLVNPLVNPLVVPGDSSRFRGKVGR